MKKMFFVIVLLISTQIVKADGPKGYGFIKSTLRGALEPAEFKDALSVLFDGSSDTKVAEYFQKVPGFSFSQMRTVYKKHIEETFDVEDVTDEEMLEIIEKTSFREVPSGYWGNHKSMYIPKDAKSYGDMEWWQPNNTRNNEFIGDLSLNGIKKDWITTFCANCVKETKKVSTKTISRERSEPEVTRFPGKKQVTIYEPDTLIEYRSSYKEVNNNSFSKINNQSFTLEAQNASYGQTCNHQQAPSHPQQCNHQRTERQESYDCGCREDYSCHGHKKAKNKKPFFNTTGGRLLVFGAGVATGAILQNNIDWPGNRRVSQGGPVITQGPLIPLPITSPIYTQAPLLNYN